VGFSQPLSRISRFLFSAFGQTKTPGAMAGRLELELVAAV